LLLVEVKQQHPLRKANAMSAAIVCPQCGKPLASDSPLGLCPECLLKAALPGQSALASTVTELHGSSGVTASATEAGEHVRYFGDYELLEEIARGGMGVVWKARQTSLKRDVALKMIRAGALASPEEVQCFLREAEAAANLQHPNIVAIHEVGEHEEQHYFSMDYIAGRNLGALVKDATLSAQAAARYVKIIAEAVHFAHQRGTLHRDLKPQNVLIDEADQPRITDFGLAKIMKDDSRLTQTGTVMGSPSYMPPEQAAGRMGEIGPASDVYSLGAMLYELLTGRPPFQGATAMATLHDVIEAEPTAPRRLKPDIPTDLETICLKCLEKAPLVRYPTARALAEELERFLKGEPIQAQPPSGVRKALYWARRHPGILAQLAAFVMVALAFAVFYLFEENAFLRAQLVDPALTRARGPRHESLKMWTWIFALLMPAGVIAISLLVQREFGLDWRNRPLVVRQPLGGRTRTLAICIGSAVIGWSVTLLARTIQVYVWEGESSGTEGIVFVVFFVYLTISGGLGILTLVIRDYRRSLYGTPGRQLTAEEIEPIRQAMEDYDVRTATELYLEAIPEATFGEATQYVYQLAVSQRAQHPDKFLPPPSLLARLNWKAMVFWGVIDAVILGVSWAILLPSHSGWFASILGLCLGHFLSVSGFTRRRTER
jgi:predicted Ser/Thr protein kinase